MQDELTNSLLFIKFNMGKLGYVDSSREVNKSKPKITDAKNEPPKVLLSQDEWKTLLKSFGTGAPLRKTRSDTRYEEAMKLKVGDNVNIQYKVKEKLTWWRCTIVGKKKNRNTEFKVVSNEEIETESNEDEDPEQRKANYYDFQPLTADSVWELTPRDE